MFEGGLLKRLGLGSFALIIAGLIQGSDVFAIQGIKPNVVLSLLFLFAFFFDEWGSYLFLAILSGIAVYFGPGFDFGPVALAAVALAFFFSRNLLPGNRFINVVLAVSVGTVVFYAVSGPGFLFGSPIIVFLEVLYNTGIAVLIYPAAHRLLSYEKGFRTSR